MTFKPGSDGRSSGLLTPSRRALAGVGRSEGTAAVKATSPERAERRETEDIVLS